VFAIAANVCDIQRAILGGLRRRARAVFSLAWALDVHLARTLGAQLIHLADTTHGWPGNEEFPEPEDWDAALRRHGATLLAYPGVVYDAVDEAPIEAAQESVRWVADHLPDLWD